MEFKIIASAQEIAQIVALEIRELILQKPNASICIAAGHSSLPLIKQLIKLNKLGVLNFSAARFIAMDEWLNMNQFTKGSCGDFLMKEFISKVNFAPENVVLVDGCDEDTAAQCRRIHSAIYDHGGLDYIVLGVGMNGHLALNEPGTDENMGVHVAKLDTTTKEVGVKYFANTPVLEGGVTIGIKDIKGAKKIVLCINGEHKKEIVSKFYSAKPSANLPVSFLKNCENAVVLCDKAAASLINI